MSVLRFGVSLESNLLERFDEVWKERGFANRSEAFRNLIRSFIAERELGKGRDVVGSLVLIYSFKTSGVDYRLNEVEHAYGQQITSSMHVHLDEHNCMEVIAMRGKGEEVRRIADCLISCKGVKQGKLVMTPARIE